MESSAEVCCAEKFCWPARHWLVIETGKMPRCPSPRPIPNMPDTYGRFVTNKCTAGPAWRGCPRRRQRGDPPRRCKPVQVSGCNRTLSSHPPTGPVSTSFQRYVGRRIGSPRGRDPSALRRGARRFHRIPAHPRAQPAAIRGRGGTTHRLRRRRGEAMHAHASRPQRVLAASTVTLQRGPGRWAGS